MSFDRSEIAETVQGLRKEQSGLMIFRAYYLLLVLGLIVVGGCSRSINPVGFPTPPEKVENSSQPLDQSAGNWNRQPHGGDDEKSNRSPCGPDG